jgi:hypothetical protein|tara:strand:+ start:115 stop:459 length:345 start_codon:yes stop_codon:yes gene_type:complete
LTIKTLVKEQLTDLNIYPMSVLLPLSHAAYLDQTEESINRTLKFPLLPYQANEFFLSEDETGMATFSRRSGLPFGGASKPRHQGIEFTLAVLSACEGYVNEPHLGMSVFIDMVQ